MRSFHSKADALRYSRNGNRAKPAALLMIEGESVTISQVADRLGVSHRTASGRLLDAQKQDGPVTWAKLGLK